MSAPSDNPTPPLRDRLIPWYFVMAFGVVVIVNIIFIYMATRTQPGLVVENAYEKGVQYDAIVREVRKQKQASETDGSRAP